MVNIINSHKITNEKGGGGLKIIIIIKVTNVNEPMSEKTLLLPIPSLDTPRPRSGTAIARP